MAENCRSAFRAEYQMLLVILTWHFVLQMYRFYFYRVSSKNEKSLAENKMDDTRKKLTKQRETIYRSIRF